ncbi:MAG TPA: hypothetical protein VIU34_22040 [Steroidobacter sp.]
MPITIVPVMVKHIFVVAAALIGLIAAASLLRVPPRHVPPHPSYLPER